VFQNETSRHFTQFFVLFIIVKYTILTLICKDLQHYYGNIIAFAHLIETERLCFVHHYIILDFTCEDIFSVTAIYLYCRPL